MAKLNGINFKNEGGALVHVVENDNGETIGWINEVFPDVHYTTLKDPKAQIVKRSVRFRSLEAALGSFNA